MYPPSVVFSTEKRTSFLEPPMVVAKSKEHVLIVCSMVVLVSDFEQLNNKSRPTRRE
jgi:hypothetical protein